MSLIQHNDPRVRFDQQVENSRQYVLPFIRQTLELRPGSRVLEVGTAEGGVLVPFEELGCRCLGVDLAAHRIELAKQFCAGQIAAGTMDFRVQNIYEEAFLKEFAGTMDLIILKDVIEHVPNQEAFIPFLRKFLKPGGQIFFGFPPWYMPFGGHQQICEHALTSKMPWYHILPMPLYRGILKMAGESEGAIQELTEIKETQITIERFERIVRKSGLKVVNRQHYLINPIYLYKFGLKARKQSPLISAIPYVRDFLTTCVYYTVS